MTHFRVRLHVAAIVAALLPSLGFAQAARHFDIPAQDATAALRTAALQGDFEILIPPKLVGEKRTKALTGEFSNEAALRKLLEGTGLTYRAVGARTFVVEEARANGGPQQNPIQLAQAPTETDRAGASDSKPAKAEKIEVTGSRLPRALGEGPQRVQVYDREQIENSGQPTLQRFLATLPEVSTGGGEGAFELFGAQTTVRLRGLPVGTTLLLLNGRRIEASGSTVGGPTGMFFDLSTIPMAAIERIEVLAEGSSAIYGSDALAGVINIILKKNLNGGEIVTRYDHADGFDEGNASLAWGHRWDRASVTALVSYLKRNELQASERAFLADMDYRRVGGADRRFMNCDPGTVFSTTTANLPGLTSTFAAIPNGTGRPAVSAFRAGVANSCSHFAESSLIPKVERISFLVEGTYDLTPSTELFGELIYTQMNRESRFTHPTLSQRLVPASNAFNPFGVPVRVSYSFQDIPRGGVVSDVDFGRALFGARGAIASGWEWETAAWISRDEDTFSTETGQFLGANGLPATTNTNLDAALASSNPATALNLFGSGPPGSPELLASLYGSTVLTAIGERVAASALLRGRLAWLPWGDVDVAVGGEITRDRVLSSQLVSNFYFDGYRRARAVYGEMRAPLWRMGSGAQGRDLIALTAAARHDVFSDYGGSTTGQGGIEVRPWRDLLFRTAYSTAFRAPALGSLYSPDQNFAGAVTDPRRNNQSTTIVQILGGNSDLRPESGTSKSAGVAWVPARIKGLEMSVTAFEIEQEDRVASISAQVIVNNESLFPGRVVRGPDVNGQPGAIQTVDARYANFGRLETSGIDYRISYAIGTAAGVFTPALAATNVRKYRAAVTPNAPITDRLGIATADGWAPRWKGVASLGWKLAPVSASISGRYVNRYQDYAKLPNGQINWLGDFWTWDVSARVEIGKPWLRGMPWISSAYVVAGAVNVGDAPLRYSAFSPAFAIDPSQYDPVGRRLFLSIGARF